MKRIKPNGLFEVWSPDQVAECLEGVPTELYAKLWNDFVPEYDGKRRSECNDDFASRALVKFWKRLTVEEQVLLNELAAKEDERYAEWRLGC